MGAAPDADRPEFARAALARPGMWDSTPRCAVSTTDGRERASPPVWAAPFDLARAG
jgi:hypothetical protein